MFRFFEDYEDKKNPSGNYSKLALGTESSLIAPSPSKKQNINSWNYITRPVDQAAMSYQPQKLSYSANNVSNTLLPHHRPTNSLSKSAGNIPTTPTIERIVGFGQDATTYLVQLPILSPVTPAEIEYEEGSSPTSDNNSNSASNGNYFLPVTRQNANPNIDAETSTDLSPNWGNSNARLSAPHQNEENSAKRVVISASSSENGNQSTEASEHPTNQEYDDHDVFNVRGEH